MQNTALRCLASNKYKFLGAEPSTFAVFIQINKTKNGVPHDLAHRLTKALFTFKTSYGWRGTRKYKTVITLGGWGGGGPR